MRNWKEFEARLDRVDLRKLAVEWDISVTDIHTELRGDWSVMYRMWLLLKFPAEAREVPGNTLSKKAIFLTQLHDQRQYVDDVVFAWLL